MGSEQSQLSGSKSTSGLKRDSPKVPAKHISRAKKTNLLRRSSQIASSSGHNIVVVKHAAPEDSPDQDTDLQRLKSIPMFLPIMRGTVNLPEARDPEVFERLDSGALYRMCQHYQEYLRQYATTVAKDQNAIYEDIKQVDIKSSALIKTYMDHEKSIRKHSERLNKISEISLKLSDCHLMLNQTVDTLEKLNNSLPPEHRLEPFVWTTG